MITFSTLATTLRSKLWPAGEALTLRTAHTSYIKQAMADIQKWVPQLQAVNTTVWARCDRFWEDAKSVVEAPNGKIRRVFTITNDEWRDKVFYKSEDFVELEKIAKRVFQEAATPPNTSLPSLSFGYRYEESSVDSDVGRSRAGLWAIYRQKLFVAPWLQSNEKLVAEWDGVKTVYDDADQVNDELWTTDVLEAVEFYVMWMHEKFFGDRSLAVDWERSYREKLADLMSVFNDRTRRQQDEPVPEAITQLTSEQVEDDLDAAEDAEDECDPLPSELPDTSPDGSLFAVGVFSGEGSPEGVLAKGVGSIYTDISDPDHPVTWKKTSGGYTSTGWVQELAL